VKQEFSILIADRNRHVRDLLKREMNAEGYRVYTAKNAQEVLKWVFSQESLDLVILDLDLPEANGICILEKINDRIPTLPVVVHSFLSDYTYHPMLLDAAGVVEKNGVSIVKLKEVVSEVLKNPKTGDWIP